MRIAIISIVVVIAGLIGLRLFSDPVPQDRLNDLRAGMTKQEVREVIGNPTGDYDGHWSYSRFMVFGFVNIHFDAGGRYLGDYNYERF